MLFEALAFFLLDCARLGERRDVELRAKDIPRPPFQYNFVKLLTIYLTLRFTVMQLLHNYYVKMIGTV